MSDPTQNVAELRPLCVDLDGTLVKTDTLLEGIILLIRKNPLFIFLFPYWLSKGRAWFKREVAKRVRLNVAYLPYHAEFLEYLQNEHQLGRRLVLTTSANVRVAKKVAEYVGLFSDVIASDGVQNLSGADKRRILEARFGVQGFDYAGNDWLDLKVWAGAKSALIVNALPALIKKAQGLYPVAHVFETPRNYLLLLVKMTRVYQWVKNLLIFLPIVLAHRFLEPQIMLNASRAFIAFSFCATSMYLLNDLMDLNADRAHPKKRYRPLASGDVPIWVGALMIPVFLSAGLFAARPLSHQFFLILLVYVSATILYSFWIKYKTLVDVMLLAGLYTVRVFAGSLASGIKISQWLLAFSVFLFVTLAFLKRYSELLTFKLSQKQDIKGRGYVPDDLGQIANFGVASGYIAVLILALYINSHHGTKLYAHTQFLWFICPLLMYWISRLWLIAYRGEMHHDPVIFAIKDKMSYLIIFLGLWIMCLAL